MFRYQKKIGTYDKQQWEKTVEQRILHGINHIQLKTAKPKTDLIDLDLVRGSSFTKAKPKHGFLTVARLSTQRIILLPVYAKWWVQQTSGKIFGILLLLYLLQLVNIAIYSYNTSEDADVLQGVPTSEIIVPIVMMWVLSFIHSQIVATNPGPDNSKLQPKFRKSYHRRTRRSRKHLNADSSIDCKDGKEPTNYHVTWRSNRNWKKENLGKPSSKNVLFEENDVIIPEKRNGPSGGATVNNLSVTSNINNNATNRRPATNGHPLEDDGFESLNGNGSSPSDIGDEFAVPIKASPKRGNQISNGNKSDTNDRVHTLRCKEWVKEVQGSRFSSSRRQSAPDLRFSSGEMDSDSDTYTATRIGLRMMKERRNSQIPLIGKAHNESACDTDEEGECETLSSPETMGSGRIEAATSGAEWMGITTNSEDCSYSSELSESDTQIENFDIDAPPNSILSPYCGPSDRVSCTIWDRREIKKADLSVIEISSVIIARVERMPESMDYFYIGLVVTTILALLPITCRFCYAAIDSSNLDELQLTLFQITQVIFGKFSDSCTDIIDALLGTTPWERAVMLIATLQRWVLGFLLFFLLAVAERTFKQRFLYAKLFSHLTSSRRAKKSELPHFRLNKVRNIKTWLSVRSYLKKRGPQRSVDVIVSAAFIVTLLLLSFLCMELLKESFMLNSQYNLEIMIWSIGLGILILRFMTLGVKINKKYRNLSVLITEQINLYLQIEQKPNKKEELMVANSVLKLAADLLKELESQFKILGLSANPFLYNITKVVILSALSGVLSEILGFKLKLHKIKIK